MSNAYAKNWNSQSRSGRVVSGRVGPAVGSGGTIDRLRRRFADLPAPVIVYNKSHSGSRLLAQMLEDQGVFIGGRLNESNDAMAILPLVERLVEDYYPDYQALWDQDWPVDLEALFVTAMMEHLEGYDGHSPWGWKLCETTYIVPIIAAVFPRARFVHLLRDGLDVAFSDHVPPQARFWRKVYFNNGDIQGWRGLSMTNRAYVRRPHIYNALHWLNSVEVGRTYGAMLQGRYLEVRYEDLCRDFLPTSRRILGFMGLAPDEAALMARAASVRKGTIGKHHRHRRQRRQVLRLIEPTLLSLGYLDAPSRPGPLWRLRERWYSALREMGKGWARLCQAVRA
ncbi:sulfotransferase family protein [Nitrospirillum pindoramense]|uniref:Sulfotransferase family protein n=1 Tax=Nitrospirillum amazonense TaxID=28077 RepID=A0A560H424_9PROT|nr:sulfotransferase [Nitrospirillum amazonense]TWB40454.1 sulfotransferase family protein [Nitrospirillum amazonense]